MIISEPVRNLTSHPFLPLGGRDLAHNPAEASRRDSTRRFSGFARDNGASGIPEAADRAIAIFRRGEGTRERLRDDNQMPARYAAGGFQQREPEARASVMVAPTGLD